MNFLEFSEKFPTEKAVIEHFIKTRYRSSVPTCPHCGGISKISPEKDRPKFFHCNDCNNSFSIFKDTIFEKSSTDLRKWMYAIHLFLNGKKGISGYQLQREISVTYKTAWRMLKQIRLAMANTEAQEFTETIIEIDETYVGGKPRKGNKKKAGDGDDSDGGTTPLKRGRGTLKTPVIGVIDRTTKRVHARVAMPNKDGKCLTGKQLLDVLREVARGKSTVMTDEFKGYNILRTTEHIHLKVDHNKMFVDGDIHTNNIENFWGNVKRGILGIYHHVSKKYLQMYIDEFCFRYNHCHAGCVFDELLAQCVFTKKAS